jgi:phosphoglucomutase
MAHELAGKLPPPSLLIDVAALERAYFEPVDVSDATQRVAFGTSGHRGTALSRSFNEAHIIAITQATCEYRASQNVTGPLFLGKDSHALSPLAERTALEVLAANGVETVIQGGAGLSPTPAISRAILAHNADPGARRADGLIITPSHNPPADGGIKYNPPQGGPADTDVTGWIERRANELLKLNNSGVRRVTYSVAKNAATTHERDLITPYVIALDRVVDMEAIQNAKLHAAADPLGGAALPYWEQIAEYWQLDLTIVNRRIDPRFDFMTVDHDGKIRMDCSSPYAMASLVALKDQYALAFGNDADADRHGIVAPSVGLLNPNHYLAVAIEFLVKHRPQWAETQAIGKTLVSSAIIDRVVHSLGRKLYEVPVGFKWFSGGLFDGTLSFGGEESAGASFLCHDGSAWCTDKDGLIMCLLGLEMLAKTGDDPGIAYQQLEQRFGKPVYRRIDAVANVNQKAKLKSLEPTDITSTTLAGETIETIVTSAPGNNAVLGGIKVMTKNAWFAARPSGTEDLYKIYAESFLGETHLRQVLEEAQHVVDRALK